MNQSLVYIGFGFGIVLEFEISPCVSIEIRRVVNIGEDGIAGIA